jgi:hypothetical protein
MDEELTLEDAIARIDGMPEPVDSLLPEGAANHGRFVGLPAKIELDENGRSAKLIEPISYVDAAELDWPVPKGAWLDGASIPRAFWTLIGSPLTGKYREPSMVHDHYCIHHSHSWRDTHRMFYDAMLCRGVPGFKARVMFYAVYRFGPRWPEPGSLLPESTAVPTARQPDDSDAGSILEDAALLREQALDVAQIERLADERGGPRGD